MTKTAYAKRLSPEELAVELEGLDPEDREELRLENATGPLFDMWLRFESVFGDRAIDRLDISDEDAEAAAKRMEAGGPSLGARSRTSCAGSRTGVASARSATRRAPSGRPAARVSRCRSRRSTSATRSCPRETPDACHRRMEDLQRLGSRVSRWVRSPFPLSQSR